MVVHVALHMTDMLNDPEESLNVVLGIRPIQRNKYSPAEFEARIRSAQAIPTDYNEAGWAAARIVLEYLEAHPEDRDAPPESIFDYGEFNNENLLDVQSILVSEGLYQRISKSSDFSQRLDGLGLTGYLWGWAYNAGRLILELESCPNPAIMEIRLGEGFLF